MLIQADQKCKQKTVQKTKYIWMSGLRGESFYMKDAIAAIIIVSEIRILIFVCPRFYKLHAPFPGWQVIPRINGRLEVKMLKAHKFHTVDFNMTGNFKN